MDGGKGLNVGKSRRGSNRIVSVSHKLCVRPWTPVGPWSFRNCVPVSGVWSTSAAFLPRGRSSHDLLSFRTRIFHGSFGAGDEVDCQRLFSSAIFGTACALEDGGIEITRLPYPKGMGRQKAVDSAMHWLHNYSAIGGSLSLTALVAALPIFFFSGRWPTSG